MTQRLSEAQRHADAEQILIWKAALALSDNRTRWNRAMRRAIKMIEARDPEIVTDQKLIRAAPYFEAENKKRRANTGERP